MALVGNLGQARAVVGAAIVLILSHGASLALAQRAPVSPDHPWHGLGEARIEVDARNLAEPGLNLDQEKTYSCRSLSIITYLLPKSGWKSPRIGANVTSRKGA
jgi:hypothetical protein